MRSLYYYSYYYYTTNITNQIPLMEVMNMLTLVKLRNKGVLDIRWILNLPSTFYRSRTLRLLFAVICPSFNLQMSSVFWRLSERSLLCVVLWNYSFFNLGARCGWVVNATPRPLYLKESRYPLYRRLGGPHGRSVRVRKISPHTGIRSLGLPARSESL